MDGCNEGEEEEVYIAPRIIYVCGHACEACCEHSNIVFIRRIEEVCTFEFD